jgi:hypothetical protein
LNIPGERQVAKKIEIKWSKEPDKKDYPAAQVYLSLIFDKKTVAGLMVRLKRAGITQFKASDLFRASGLHFDKSQVKAGRKKILSGSNVSPLLLVRDTVRGRVIIADGFHRMCAVFSIDEEAAIPCKLA